MTDEYFNIVLVPDERTAQIATDFAQSTYLSIADEYCLREGKVFPHITLAQFKTTELGVISSLFEKVQAQAPVNLSNIKFTDLYGLPTEQDGIRYLWIGLSVQPSEQLAAIQAKAHEWVTELGLVPLNGSLSDYWPHMTFARIKEETSLPSVVVPDYFKREKCGSWTLKIGHSDPNGQFLE